MSEYTGIFILGLMAAGLTGLFVFLTSVLGPKKSNPVKDQPFECGEQPFGTPKARTPIHFYVLAMLFIIFDVELAFLFPWAVLFKKLGFIGLIEISIFVFFILVGYVYAWKKGALETQ